MSSIKGHFKSVEVAADGSEIKIRLVDGADENVARIRLADLEGFLEQLIASFATARMNDSVRPGAGKKFSAVAPVIKADDINVNWMSESNSFAVEVSDSKGRKTISMLSPAHMRFLISVYEQTQEPGFGSPRH